MEFIPKDPIVVYWNCSECGYECQQIVSIEEMLNLPIEEWNISEPSKELILSKTCMGCNPLVLLAPSRN